MIGVQQNFGASKPGPTGLSAGDANDDEVVSGQDLIAVQQNFGKALASPVPAPAAITTLLLASALTLRRTQRSSVGSNSATRSSFYAAPLRTRGVKMRTQLRPASLAA